MQSWDCIVIGSGAGGLSAAIAAGAEGRSVLVLEASSALGGYLNPFRRRGYEFDTGVHMLGGLGEGGMFRATLQELGVWDRLRFIPFDQDCAFRSIFADRGFEFRFPTDRGRLVARLVEAFPTERKGVREYAETLDRFLDVGRAFMMPFSLARWTRALTGLPRVIASMKVRLGEYMDRFTADPLLRALLASNWATYGLPPGRASAFYAFMVSADLSAAAYPAGGSRAFRDALVGRARELGVELRTLAEVTCIRRDREGFEVETAGGQRFRARTVVSNADPHHTYGRLLDASLVPPKLRDKVRRTRYSMGMFYAFIGTARDPAEHGLANGMAAVSASTDFDGMWDQMMSSDDGVMCGCFSVLSPTVRDPGGGHAPPGRHVLEVICPASFGPFSRWSGTRSMRRGSDYEEFKARIGQRLLAEVERFFPGLTKDADHVEFATPLTNEWWVKAPFGACYGPEQAPDQVNERRFPIESPVEGLFLCGAATEGGGVSPCMHSGMVAGRKAARYRG